MTEINLDMEYLTQAKEKAIEGEKLRPNYKLSHYLLYVGFVTPNLRTHLTDRDMCYTKFIQNFMENVVTRPDFPNFALPLNNQAIITQKWAFDEL